MFSAGMREAHSKSIVVEDLCPDAVQSLITFMYTGSVPLPSSEGDTCVICEDHDEVGMRVCRHGRGQACTFQLYEDRILGGIGICGVGSMLVVYSTFLYKPRGRHHKADAMEKKQAEADETMATMVRKVDEQVEVVEFLVEQRTKRTPARMMRTAWQATPCYSCAYNIGYCMNAPLSCLFALEERHAFRVRAQIAQSLLYMWTIGFGQRLFRLVFRRGAATTPRAKGMGEDGETEKRGTLGMLLHGIAGIVIYIKRTRCCLRLADTSFGKALTAAIIKMPALRAALARVGLMTPEEGEVEGLSMGGTRKAVPCYGLGVPARLREEGREESVAVWGAGTRGGSR